MSFNPSQFTVVPEDTARIAKAAFPTGNRYILLRDTFGELFESEEFKHLFHAEGRPAYDPARLALITTLQFAENLSDEEAANAVRARIDFKYLLALPLEDAGFDPSVLSEFRSRLVQNGAEQLLFDLLLARFRAHKLLRARGKQRTDSTHVLAAVKALNRLQCVRTTFRSTLDALALVAPEWLRQQARPEWLERYRRRFGHDQQPKSKDGREKLATLIGEDGFTLLSAIVSDEAPTWLQHIPAVQTLWRVWLQNYTQDEHTHVRFRSNEEIPPSRQFIGTPYDVEARLSSKYSTHWLGYKVYLTERCDEDLPHVITNVETTAATTPDFEVTKTVHASLERRNLLPDEHLVDAGFLHAELLADTPEQFGVQLLGPARKDCKRQAREGKGFAAENFGINWETKQLRCPEGKTSHSWTELEDGSGRPVVKDKFSTKDCRPCPARTECTSAKSQRRSVSLKAQVHYEAQAAQRAFQDTADFRQRYAKRAGIEGTVSQSVRVCDLRRSRYVGLAKTSVQHHVTGAAVNLLRVADWLAERPRAPTRVAAFERVLAAAA